MAHKAMLKRGAQPYSAIMLSIRPEHACNILDGIKTVELRRRFPENAAGMWLLLYASSSTRALVGAARVHRVHSLPLAQLWHTYRAAAYVSREQFNQYFADCTVGSAIILEHPIRFPRIVPLHELRGAYGLDPNVSYRWICGPATRLLNDRGL
jgi:predicted transcriptional regulator